MINNNNNETNKNNKCHSFLAVLFFFFFLQHKLFMGDSSLGLYLFLHRWSRSAVGCRGIPVLEEWATATSCSFFSNLGLPFVISHSFCFLLLFLWCFLSFLKHIAPEMLPSWLKSWAVPCSGSVGADWNHLCLVWGSPCFSSQRPLLQPPLQHQRLNTYTQDR